jgi:hypothetical protein
LALAAAGWFAGTGKPPFLFRRSDKRMDFQGHEEAIGILSKVEAELSKRGYVVEFVKKFSKEECLPAPSLAFISLRLTAVKADGDLPAGKILKDA